MAEPKSLLDRIGDALKGEEAQKKEAISKAAEAASAAPAQVEKQVAAGAQAAAAKVAEVNQAATDAAHKLEAQVSDLRVQLAQKEHAYAQKAGELVQKENAWMLEKRDLNRKIAELEAALKQAQEEAAALREQVATRTVAAAAAPAQIYTVKPGDSLSAIAKAIYGNAARWPEIFEANKDIIKDPKLIRPGQQLRIP